jgi:hypothetical protein
VRWSFRVLAVALLAACFAVTAQAGGTKKAGGKGSEAPTCGDYGTSVHFEPSPSDAARLARKEEKLVFVLHVSGDFENTDFT